MRIRLDNVRISFPVLFTPKTDFDGGTPTYSAMFLISKGDKQIESIRAIIEQVAKARWGAKYAEVLQKLYKQDRVCLRDGDAKDAASLNGYYYVSARSDKRPLVINRDRTPIRPDDGIIYPGCRVNAIVDIWAQDNQYGRRINAVLSGVQFRSDDEAFSSVSPARAEDFPDLSDLGDETGSELL